MKAIFTIVALMLTINSMAQDVRVQLKLIADDIARQIQATGKTRVAVASFLDLQNRETDLGRYMADKFSIGIGSSHLELLDRSQLSQLMRENKLASTSVLDSKTIPALGKIAGVDVIITGNYAPLDNSVDITVKAIDVQRGVRLAVAEGVIPRTPEINRLLTQVSDAIKEAVGNNGEEANSEASKQLKPASDCQAKSTCVICITNKYSEPVEVGISYTNSELV